MRWLLLWLVAAAYFLLGATSTIEWADEGHLVYLSARVAEGALPYRDLHHWYGPSVFFLNGVLLRLFGPDLLVVRLLLVAVKATTAVLVYRLADELAGRRLALLLFVFLLAVCGAPLWFFQSPYAVMYQQAFDLAALVVLLPMATAAPRRLLLAGVCFGVAATFRQTAGILAFGSFVAFLLHQEATSSRRHPLDGLAAVLRPLLVVGFLAVCAVYVGSFASPLDLLLLAPPVVLLAAASLRRVLRAGRPGAFAHLTAVLWASAGFVIAPAAYAAVYLERGALAALARDTLWGLPQSFSVRVPLPRPAWPTLGALAAIGIVLGLLRGASKRRVGVALAAVGIGAVVVLYGADRGWERVSAEAATAILLWLPAAVTWYATAVVLTTRAPAARPDLAAVAFLGAAGLLALQPVGDLPHALLVLPMYLPLLGFALARFLPASREGRGLAPAAVVALMTVVALPFVRSVIHSQMQARPAERSFTRATGIVDGSASGADAAALVRFLAATPPQTRLLVLPTGQMVQFLADRRSALETVEFGLYTGAYDQVGDDVARALVDEPAAIARLEAAPPLVVTHAGQRGADRFRKVFPLLAGYIDAHYHPIATFGRWTVLEYTAAPGAS